MTSWTLKLFKRKLLEYIGYLNLYLSKLPKWDSTASAIINLNLHLTFQFINFLISCYACLTSVPHCKMDNCSCLDIVARIKTSKIVDVIISVPNKNSIVCLLFQMNTNFCLLLATINKLCIPHLSPLCQDKSIIKSHLFSFLSRLVE